MLNNEKQVISTLRFIVGVFNKYEVEYRFLGSIITCSLEGSVYRKINDLDILVDNNKINLIADELVAYGFQKKIKNHLRVSEQLNLHIYQHPALLEISFFGIKFCSDGSANLQTKNINAYIPKTTINAEKYSLNKFTFIGIPASVVYKTILLNKSNPKRTKEIEIFKENKIEPLKDNIYSVRFKGIDITALTKLPNILLDIIGRLRLLIGKSYDIWKN